MMSMSVAFGVKCWCHGVNVMMSMSVAFGVKSWCYCNLLSVSSNGVSKLLLVSM